VSGAITAHETPGVTSIAVDDTGWDNALRRAARAATGTCPTFQPDSVVSNLELKVAIRGLSAHLDN